MRSQFVFIVLIVVIFALNCTNSSNTANNQTPLPKSIGKMVCNVNLVHDSHVNEAIKTLETKLEALIALVNKTSPPKPTLPGIDKDRNKAFSDLCVSYLYLNNCFFFFTAVPASSCKEQFEKYK